MASGCTPRRDFSRDDEPCSPKLDGDDRDATDAWSRPCKRCKSTPAVPHPDHGPSTSAKPFADVVFLISGEKIPAHKLILSLASEHFRELFRSDFRESSLHEIELQEVKADDFRALLEFVYGDTLSSSAFLTLSPTKPRLNTNNCCALLTLANRFLVSSVQAAVIDFLVDNLAKENCLDVLLMADELHLHDLRAIAMNAVVNHFTSIAVAADLNRLPYPLLLEILNSPNLNVQSECDILEVLSRLECGKELLSCVRLFGTSLEELRRIRNHDVYSKWSDLKDSIVDELFSRQERSERHLDSPLQPIPRQKIPPSSSEIRKKGLMRCMVLHGPGLNATVAGQLRRRLVEMGTLDVVLFDASAQVPSLPELQAVEAVLVYCDCFGFADAVALGDLLAVYVDQGGRVVCVENSSLVLTKTRGDLVSDRLDGRWLSGRYSALDAKVNTTFEYVYKWTDYELELIDESVRGVLSGLSFSSVGWKLPYFVQTHPCILQHGARSLIKGEGNDALLAIRWRSHEKSSFVATCTLPPGPVVGINFVPPCSDDAAMCRQLVLFHARLLRFITSSDVEKLRP